MEEEQDKIRNDHDYIAGMLISILNHTEKQMEGFSSDGLTYYTKKQEIFSELLSKSGYKIISL